MARVGIVTSWFERGAAIVSRQIRDAIVASGAECRIYARGEMLATGDPRWNTSDVHWGKRLYWPGSGKIDRADFLDWLDREAIDVLLFNEQRWWQPILWAKDRGIRCAAYVDYYRPQDIDAFDAYDLLVVNTERHQSAFAWHPGVRLVPWGTDCALFAPQAQTNPPRPLTFFHSAGWDGHRKGTDLVLAAFERIRHRCDARLVIHSQGAVDGIDGADPRIDLIQRTVAAPGLYHLGDVYVYPSRLEGIGLTICEALACGLPVITTDEPPMNEFVRDARAGWRVAVEKRYRRSDGYYWPCAEVSVDALADAMLVAAGMDEAALAGRRNAARATALRERDWARNAAVLGDLLASVEPRSLSDRARRAIAAIDGAGWRGKVDRLLDTPILSPAIQRAMRRYRRWRQPELYGNG